MDYALFSRQDIFDFLIDKNKIFASHSWFTEKGVEGDITHLEASNWFQTYFPSHNAYILFRQLECEKSQFIPL